MKPNKGPDDSVGLDRRQLALRLVILVLSVGGLLIAAPSTLHGNVKAVVGSALVLVGIAGSLWSIVHGIRHPDRPI